MKPTNFFSLALIFNFFILFNNSIVSATEEEEGVDFSYVGKKGPAFWDQLVGSSEVCRTGMRQSPIDITTELLSEKKEPPKSEFNDACDVKMTNNGNTVEVSSGEENSTLPATLFSSDDGTKYVLDQFHFHTPSEHRVNEKHFDVEQHFVFSKVEGPNPNEIAVVAVFYNMGDEDNAFLKPMIDNLPKNVGDTTKVKKVKLSKLIQDIDNISNAFNYDGSLTTPPCTETVEWYVNQKPLSLSAHQFTMLRDVTGFNSRFTQLRADESVVKKRSPSKLRKLFRR